MLKNNLKNKFYALMLILFVIIFVVWILFFILINNYITKSTQSHLDNTAAQIMNDLDKEFTHVEQLVFTLRQSPTVKSFVADEDIASFYQKSAAVDELLLNSNSDQAFVNSVICYTKEGYFYRFLTPIGNTASTRVYDILLQKDYPNYIVLKSETENLIGYGSKIYDNSKFIGLIAVLINSDALASQLYTYDTQATFHIAVAVDDTIIVSNLINDSTTSVSELISASSFHTFQKIGVTPYNIIISVDRAYINTSNIYFIVATAATTLAFVIALLFFAHILRKQFLSPMMTVINHVENLDINHSPTSLPMINNTEFASLVEKINEMLQRIESKNKAIQNAELQIKNTEIQKHKAIIYSMKKQINAHFTVNIINIIKILISKNDLEKSVALCDGLSMLIRYAHDEDEFINAWDEFQVLSNYIGIMNIRYNDKFITDFDIDDRFMDYKIPRMLLQPIIENAIVHGYRNHQQDCKIDITGSLVDNHLEIIIRDYGEGMPTSQLDDMQTKLSEDGTYPTGINHIALLNIDCRIKSYYGKNSGISIVSSTDGGTIITVKLGDTFSV